MSRPTKNDAINATTPAGDGPLRDLVAVFKALSDETRLRILKVLEHGELCVCDIVAAFDMIQPKVSFHLNVLKQAGLLTDRKEGRWMHYGIDGTDLFKRLLMLSVVEKIPRDMIEEDTKRLREFLASKMQGTTPKACCRQKSK
jgi:ArsR family transcriptional regulator, arsenate/arsenite/antimonite-responsive transcriptional repressor